jgi:hypothetical protein
VLQERFTGERAQFLVAWDGASISEATWESRASIKANYPGVVKEFEEGQAAEYVLFGLPAGQRLMHVFIVVSRQPSAHDPPSVARCENCCRTTILPPMKTRTWTRRRDTMWLRSGVTLQLRRQRRQLQAMKTH